MKKLLKKIFAIILILALLQITPILFILLDIYAENNTLLLSNEFVLFSALALVILGLSHILERHYKWGWDINY